jgi:hypothetical protein
MTLRRARSPTAAPSPSLGTAGQSQKWHPSGPRHGECIRPLARGAVFPTRCRSSSGPIRNDRFFLMHLADIPSQDCSLRQVLFWIGRSFGRSPVVVSTGAADRLFGLAYRESLLHSLAGGRCWNHDSTSLLRTNAVCRHGSVWRLHANATAAKHRMSGKHVDGASVRASAE